MPRSIRLKTTISLSLLTPSLLFISSFSLSTPRLSRTSTTHSPSRPPLTGWPNHRRPLPVVLVGLLCSPATAPTPLSLSPSLAQIYKTPCPPPSPATSILADCLCSPVVPTETPTAAPSPFPLAGFSLSHSHTPKSQTLTPPHPQPHRLSCRLCRPSTTLTGAFPHRPPLPDHRCPTPVTPPTPPHFSPYLHCATFPEKSNWRN